MEIDEENNSNNQTAISIPFSWVKKMRDFYRDALLGRPIKIEENIDFSDEESSENVYLWHNLTLDLSFQQPMKAIAYCKDVETALRATVFWIGFEAYRGGRAPGRIVANPSNFHLVG
jgi:hypothetical protein